MRFPRQRKLIDRSTPQAIPLTIPAPIGGLNSRDSFALMQPTDAIILDNLFPEDTTVDLRRGYLEHATFQGQCESLLVYTGANVTRIFVAVRDGSFRTIYDGTAAGLLSTAAVGGPANTVQALTSSRFDYVNFGNISGQYLFAVNGQDPGLQYNGTAWAAWTVTGVATADIFTLAVYAERLWMGQKNSFDVWYLPVNAITGTAVRLNLGSLFKEGGALSNIITWSSDRGAQLADYIAFVSTEGEVIAFRGTNPADANNWVRAVHFQIGRPVTKGMRCWAKYGAETIILCADGAFPMTKAIQSERADVSWAVSDKIAPSFNRDVAVHGARFGWHIVLHPTGKKLIVNVPTNELVSGYQWVMNSQSKAWCRFKGWTAFCLAVARDTFYFAGNGQLVKADQSTSDGANSIEFDAEQAFSHLGGRGTKKQAHLMRPILTINGPLQISLGVNVDYDHRPPTSTINITGAAGDPWAVPWSAPFSGAASVYKGFHKVSGLGFAFAPRMRGVASEISMSWSVTDLTYTPSRVGIL